MSDKGRQRRSMLVLMSPVVVEVLRQSQFAGKLTASIVPCDGMQIAVVVLMRILPLPSDRDIEGVDLVVTGSVLQSEDEAISRLAEIARMDIIDRDLLVVAGPPSLINRRRTVAAGLDDDDIAHEMELLPQRG